MMNYLIGNKLKVKPTKAEVEKLLKEFENRSKALIGTSGSYAYAAGYYSSIITHFLSNSTDSETVNTIMRQLKDRI
jgi:hypothetical protein